LLLQKLTSLVKENHATFNSSAILFVENIQSKLDQYQKFGKQFSAEMEKLQIGNTLPENNEALQARFTKAAAWYYKELSAYADNLLTSTALTNNKEVAKQYDNLLKEIYTSIALSTHIFEALEKGFNYNIYQEAKRGFMATSLTITANAKGNSTGFKHATHPILYNELKNYRDDYAEQMNEQTFMVLGNKTLDELATYLPKTKQDLEQITGFGKTKIKQFGSIFLQMINHYCEENNVETLIHTKLQTKKPVEAKKADKANTYEESYKLFKENKTINQIATERNLKPETIQSHLGKFVRSGEIAITELMPLEKATKVINALKDFDKTLGITPIQAKLGNEYSFGEIRLVLLHIEFVKEREESK
jgi:hypothetical protein